MRFTGQIRIPDLDHPGIPATFLVEDSHAELLVDGESLGRWSLYDVHARRLVASAFEVDLAGEEVTFVADEPMDFAYKGVEHMAEAWARLQAMSFPRRRLAVRKTRLAAADSRISDLRGAMEENLRVQEARPTAFFGPAAEEPAGAAVAERIEQARGETEPAPAEAPTAPSQPAGVEEVPGADPYERLMAEAEARRLEAQRLVAAAEARLAERESLIAEARKLAGEPEKVVEPAAEEVEEPEPAEASEAVEPVGEPEKVVEPAAEEVEEPEPAEASEAVEPVEEPETVVEPAAEEVEEEPGPVGQPGAAAWVKESEPAETPQPVDEREELVAAAQGVEAVDDSPAGPPAEVGQDRRGLVVDLSDLEEAARAGRLAEPALAGAAPQKSGLMGAVRAAFVRGSRTHTHEFVSAPGGIGITRQVCVECGYVSISVADDS